MATPDAKLNRLDIPDPRRVGGNRLKVGMAKAYRVAPQAVKCLKVKTNIVDAKEAAPESEAGLRRSNHHPTLDGIHRSCWPRPDTTPTPFSGGSSYIWSRLCRRLPGLHCNGQS